MSDDTLRGAGAPDVDDPRPSPPPPTDTAPRLDPRGPAPDDDAAATPATCGPYDADFFAAIDAESYASAQAVVPRVVGLTGARSIVDVGCGSGAWSRACRDIGVPEVVGIDGGHVPGAHREVGTEFVEHDLVEPLSLDRYFSLAICVEVAEHLPAERAPGLIADLTSLAPVVLFSAAVPGQGGTGHVNEQWSEYWVALFEAHGWTCRDAIRPWVRTNEQVAWWYRQNLYLAVAPSADGAYSSFPKLDSIRIPNPVDYLRRPDGDVMHPPGAAPTADAAADTAADTAPRSAEAPPITQPGTTAETPDEQAAHPAAAAPDRDAPDTDAPDAVVADDVDPGAATDDAGDTATGGDATDRDDERGKRDAANAAFWGDDSGTTRPADESDHPKPPGWDALKRLTRRGRRRRD
jgi:SAM-dependent methyltransferase